MIYRESPAYLDEAMPLNIFTSMFWYVKLSRCGLVLNRNLPIDEVYDVDVALRQYESTQGGTDMGEDELAKLEGTLKKNRFLTLGMAQHRLGRTHASGWYRQTGSLLKKIEALFE